MKRLSVSYFYVFLVLFICSCSNERKEIQVHQGEFMPGFRLLLPDSLSYFMSETIPKNQAVVLFEFGPDCPYSRAQIEEIVSHISALNDVRFVLSTSWPFDKMKNIYREYNLLRFSNITIGLDNSNFFTNYFKSEGVPFLAIYGKDRRLKTSFMGKVSYKDILSLVKR